MRKLKQIGVVATIYGLIAVISCFGEGRTSLTYPNFSIPRYNGDYLNKIRTDRLITPHVKFAKPLYGGSIKALIIVPLSGYSSRDVVELYQRFDMKFSAVTVYRPNKFQDDYPYTTAVMGQSTLEKTRELKRKLQEKYDVIILANFLFDKLPVSCRLLLLRAVKSGTGLVEFFNNTKSKKYPIYQPYNDFTGKDVIGDVALKGTWLSKTAQYRDGNGKRVLRYANFDNLQIADMWFKAYRFGKGRIATLYSGAGNLAPYPHTSAMGYACVGEPGTYDIAMQIAAKAIIWAADRKLPATITCDLKSGREFVNPRNISVEFSAHVEDQKIPKPTFIRLVIKDIDGVDEFSEKIKCAGSVNIALPILKNGEHFLTYILKDGRGEVLDFGSTYFKIKRDSEIKLTLAKSVVMPYGEVALKVELNDIPKNADIEYKAVDSYGRVFWKHKSSMTETEVKVPLINALGRYVNIIATLRLDGEVIDQSKWEVFIKRQNGKKFVRLMWGNYGDSRENYLWDLSGRQLKNAGVTHGMIFMGEDVIKRAEAFSRLDTGWMVYAAHVSTPWIARFFDPKKRKKEELRLEKIGDELKPFGAYLYSLGDENTYSYTEKIKGHSLTSYQKFLRRRYNDNISDLNKLWKTKYNDFLDVRPLSDPTKANKRIPPTRRFDQLCFWEWVYADTHHWMADAIRKGDPEAKVGAEGSAPGDLELTLSKLDWWAPYEGAQNVMLKFWMKGAHRGNWWGGYTANHGARAGVPVLWRQLLSGSVNSSMFFISAIHSEGMFASDLWYAEFYENMIDELKFIQNGPGVLLKNSEIIDDGVAIYWSKANEHASNFYPEFGSCAITRNSLISSLQKMGVNAKFVTPRQIGLAGLEPSKTKILIMPLAQIIPQNILPALKRYVENGGIIVADIVPGTIDPFMVRIGYRTEIKKLFGFRTSSTLPVPKKTQVNFMVNLGKRDIQLTGEGVLADASIKVTSAEAMAKSETPIFLLNKHGYGSAILLNRNIYKMLVAPGSTLLSDLLALAGVRSVMKTLNNDWTFITGFRQADATIIGMQRENTKPDEIIFDRKYSVYDLKRCNFLGVSDRIKVTDGKQFLFSLLPTAKRVVKLKTKGIIKCGEEIRMTAKVESAGKPVRHSLLKVELFDSDKNLVEYYTTFAFSGKESRNIRIPTALNDKKGNWKIRVTELSSGIFVEKMVAFE